MNLDASAIVVQLLFYSNALGREMIQMVLSFQDLGVKAQHSNADNQQH
jgi:hypothetical protein